jgi:phospholipase/carboxylesterase
VVVPARGEAARDLLERLGYGVRWATFPMGHEVCVEEVETIRDWLLQRLSKS